MHPAIFGDSRFEFSQGTEATRNASWGVRSPGIIADEIASLDVDVRSLSRDVWVRFRDPYHEAQIVAEQRFEKEFGRKPQGHDDYERVYGRMEPMPWPVDIENRSYQGRWVEEFERFVAAWGEFLAGHTHWYQRLWGGVYDQVMDYRRKLLKWRESFQALGGVPTSPTPDAPPDDTAPSWTSRPLVWVGVSAAGLALGYWFLRKR